MIKLDNVKKSYRMGDTVLEVLKGISFTIARGELVAIVGPSGSGKSTTMNILGLLDKPTSGKYYLDDIDTADFENDRLAELRNERLGFIFQQFFLLPKLSAIENVMLPLSYRHVNKPSEKEIKELALFFLDKVDMARFASHKPTELSGGQQQRVAIARALIGKPSIILADEPTGALDTKTTQQIMELLTNELEQEKTTVVIITHSLEVAAQCHRAIHVRDGLLGSNP